MKPLIFFCLFIFFLPFVEGSARCVAQTTTPVFDRIEEALHTGDTDKLAAHLSPFVDLHMGGKRKTHSKEQAVLVCRHFFQQHPPASFSFAHAGKGAKGGRYAIGLYESTDGESYSVLVKMRSARKTQRIYEMSFVAE